MSASGPVDILFLSQTWNVALVAANAARAAPGRRVKIDGLQAMPFTAPTISNANRRMLSTGTTLASRSIQGLTIDRRVGV
jgi:hypothetical protein